MKIHNIFQQNLEPSIKEVIEILLEKASFKLERIISTGQSTPPGEWYDQETNEWVILLSGSAGLLFKGENEPILMRPGDFVHIPAHKLHRVEWTDAKNRTLWLALHYYE